MKKEQIFRLLNANNYPRKIKRDSDCGLVIYITLHYF